jgi:hypothetical protein
VASIANLSERFLYDRLPIGLIDLDERGLIAAVIGGIQDRFDDLRAFGDNLSFLFSPAVLPQQGPNVVLVQLTSDQGKAYTRSLNIDNTTPPSTSAATVLIDWAASELGVESSTIQSVSYGRDLLRLVDEKILDFLATNVGAVLYSTAILQNQPGLIAESGTFTATDLAHQKLLATYFPRLKFKGTPTSFEALGRLLGFEDVRFTALWTRLSPHTPNDVGAPINDEDFAPLPDFWPRQEIGPFYNPHLMDDGPFYAWSGTASAGTSTTTFYTQAVNGFNPYVQVSVVGTAVDGEIPHPDSGTYTLAGGGPHTKAVAQAGSLYFEALGEGASFNGLTVNIFPVDNGTLRGVAVYDRLSSVKYRSSYYDLGLTVGFDKAEATFGTIVARQNKDLVGGQSVAGFVGTLVPVSPYRPYRAGSLTTTGTSFDFLTQSTGTIESYVERTQAGVTDYQQDYSALLTAGVQVAAAMEEVRPATRSPRRTSVGYLLNDQAVYAAYSASQHLLSIAAGVSSTTSSGSLTQHPLAPYTADLVFQTATSNGTFAAETNPTDQNSIYYRYAHGAGTINGRVTLTGTGSDTYQLVTNGSFGQAGTVVAGFTVMSSEVIRPTPSGSLFQTGTSLFLDTITKSSVSNSGSVFGDTLSWTHIVSGSNAVVTAAIGIYGSGSLTSLKYDGLSFGGLFQEVHIIDNTLRSVAAIHYHPTVGTHTVLATFNGSVASAGMAQTLFGVDLASLYQTSFGNRLSANASGNSTAFISGAYTSGAVAVGAASWKSVAGTLTDSVHDISHVYTSGSRTWLLNADNIGVGLSGAFSWSNLGSGVSGDVVGFVISPGTLVGVTYGTVVSVAYQDRPEDEIDTDQEYQLVDDYPWRRDLVGGGELVDVDMFAPIDVSATVVQLDDTVSVKDQTGAEYNVYVAESRAFKTRWVTEARSATDYLPGQKAIGFTGALRDQSTLSPDDLDFHPSTGLRTIASRNDLDVVLEPDYGLYHVGLVNGVLVADPTGFNRAHHRTGLISWWAFNEHPDDQLAITDGVSTISETLIAPTLHAEHRIWDSQRGWYLDIPPSEWVQSRVTQPLDDFCLSFWLRVAKRLNDVRILDFAPFFVDLVDQGATLNFKVRQEDGTEVLLTQKPVPLSTFNQVYINKLDNSLTCSVASLMGMQDATTVAQATEAFPTQPVLRWQVPGTVISGRPTVDIMLCVDLSASTNPIIDQIKAKILTFDSYLSALGYDTNYGLVTFGDHTSLPFTPDFLQDLTDFTTFSAPAGAFDSMTASASGAIEFGHQAISLACTSATWRTGSLRLVILLTDEDDDNGPYVGHPTDATEISAGRSDLTSVGARFYYAGYLSQLDVPQTGGTGRDPRDYQDTADQHLGKGYDILDFIDDATPMLRDLGAILQSDLRGDGIGLHDVRLWNRAKTAAELDLVRNHGPVSTMVPYPLGAVKSLGLETPYGFGVMDSGYVTPTALPAWFHKPKYARVVRYDGHGQYQGEPRFKEVGLGGGQQLPFTYKLGNQGYGLTAAGTAVVSTQHGFLPGISSFWGTDTSTGTYIFLNGSISTGSIATLHASGSGASPWPNYMEATNPTQDRLWVKGDDLSVYQVTLESNGVTPRFVAARTAGARSDAELTLAGALRTLTTSGSCSTIMSRGTIYPNQLLVSAGTSVAYDNGAGALVASGQILSGVLSASTGSVQVLTTGVTEVRVLMPKSLYFGDVVSGAVTEVATPGTIMGVTTAGTLYQKRNSGTITRPPAYLYLHTQLLQDVSGASTLAHWQDQTSYGLSQGVPALQEPGALTFVNTGGLAAGTYRIKLDTGNIGQVDREFDGFKVELTIGATILQRTLLSGFSGADFRGQDEFEFTTEDAISGDWLLIVSWTNGFDDQHRGTQRRLAVYGYQLRQLSTQLYKVSIAATGTTPNLTLMNTGTTYGTSTTPGGWTAHYNGFGTIERWVHEANIYQRNDTLISRVSLADTLTGCTSRRREDVLFASGSVAFVLLPDVSDSPLSSFGTGFTVF